MDRLIGTYMIDGYTLEYSIMGEKGEPVLVMHGGHSNCYEEFGYEPLLEKGFMLITPSRAGYGNTSPGIGTSLEKACSYYVKLLDHLGIDQVHVLSISAGGPSGLYLAAHHPERVKTLTLQSAVTKEWLKPQDRLYKVASIAFRPYAEKVTWKITSGLTDLFPAFIFKQMTSSFSTLPYPDIQKRLSHADIEEVRKMNNRQRSGHGFLIDLKQTKAITEQDMRAISAPVLILHSKHDGAVPLDHPNHAHDTIPDAALCLLDTWGHLLWLGKGAEEMTETHTDFLEKHSYIAE